MHLAEGLRGELVQVIEISVSLLPSSDNRVLLVLRLSLCRTVQRLALLQ